MERRTIIIIGFVVAVLLIIAAVLFFSGSLLKPTPQKYSVDLEVWGLFDDTDAFADMFSNYKKIAPNIRQINYRKLTVDTYKSELLEALASGQGPDIFIIHNTWLPSFQDKLIAAPATILNEQKFRSDFVDVAADDFLANGEVYAVPLSIDSLALYYNKDIFNNAGIAVPPTNWDSFRSNVKLLTRVDNFGGISRSGAALGTAYNINRPTDILSMLMLQQESKMSERDRMSFGDAGGKSALAFYTEFAKANSQFYSWNPQMHNSLDAFSEGNLAMMFNYSWQIEAIKKKSPKLNFTVAPIPQIPGKSRINYANYWGYGVSKNKVIKVDAAVAQSKSILPTTNEVRVAEAWKLLKFMTAKAGVADYVVNGKQLLDPKYDGAMDYMAKTNKPVARRDLIDLQRADPVMGVFATQNLFAKSWRQKNPELIEGMMMEMIRHVNSGEQTIDDAIRNAETQINQALGN